MLYLAGTILTNVALYIIFKLFAKYHVDSLQAIVINYFTCFIVGCLFMGEMPVEAATVKQPWFPISLLMGLMLIVLFNVIAYCTKQEGITTTTIANKLSLAIPVISSVFLYNEQMHAGEIAGVILAFPAIYMTTKRPDDKAVPRSILWPGLLFLGSGLLDTIVKYAQHHYLDNAHEQTSYTIHVFLIAALLGTLIVIFKRRKNFRFEAKNLVAGVALGIPNFFSIYLFIRLLHSNVLQSSAAIPVNNISIVLLSALAAIFFFREKVTALRIAGLALAVISILLIALSDMNG